MRLVSNSVQMKYQRLVNDEGILIQLIELLKANGEIEEAKYLSEIKGFVNIKRLHMKDQLMGDI